MRPVGSSVILADQVSPLPCFYSNSTETGKLTIIVHSWSVRVRQTISIACWVSGGGREEGEAPFQQEIIFQESNGLEGEL